MRRLIDADALMKKLGIGKDCSVCEQNDTPYCRWKPDVVDVCEAICEAPTIEVQPEQRWIPVTERLPEDGKWCLFTDGVNSSVERYKADAMDHFFPEGRWFGLEDTVAWMPLPEPYQGERQEE